MSVKLSLCIGPNPLYKTNKTDTVSRLVKGREAYVSSLRLYNVLFSVSNIDRGKGRFLFLPTGQGLDVSPVLLPSVSQ